MATHILFQAAEVFLGFDIDLSTQGRSWTPPMLQAMPA